MLFGLLDSQSGAETERLNQIVRDGRRALDKADIDALEAAARRHLPGNVGGLSYVDYVEIVRRNYQGCQADRTRAVLNHRYPASGSKMPVVTLNITTETAELKAQAYRTNPTRWLEVDGEPLADDDPRAIRFADVVDRARLSVMLPEAEKICMAVGAVVGKIRWSMIEGRFKRRERPEVSIFWPSQVLAIPDPRAPGKLWASRVVIVRLDDGQSDGATREIWIRDGVAETDDGVPLDRGGWWFGRYGADGETILPMAQYPGDDLPFFKLTAVPCEGLYPEVDRDLVALQDEVNVALSDHWYKAAMQSHQQGYTIGDRPKPGQKRVMGPGTLLELPEGASIGVLPSDYDNDRLDGIEKTLLMHARANRLPVDAWFTKGGNPETGVSRQIRNLHSDQKRGEHVALFVEVEEESILPLLARVADRWGDLDGAIDEGGIAYRCRFAKPEVFEDPNTKQARLKTDRADGIISPARYAVEMGYYPSEEEAEAAGLSRKVKEAPKPVPPMMGPPPPADDEADDDGGQGDEG